jgi:hypothetical protein
MVGWPSWWLLYEPVIQIVLGSIPNIPQTVNMVQHNICVMIQTLSQIFRETRQIPAFP